MGEQRNLTEENVDELKAHLEEMQVDNPDLEYRFFPQENIPKEDDEDIKTILTDIRDDIDAIYRKLDLIFDGHVLMDGNFIKYDK